MFSTGFTYGLGNINRSKFGTGIGRMGLTPLLPRFGALIIVHIVQM